MCKRASAVVLCAAVLAMIVACAPTIAAQSPRIVDSVATLPPRPANTDPGTLLAAEVFEVSDQLADAAAGAFRIRYRSTEMSGNRRTEVTGAAFVPRGTAPPDGWPIIAFAHGTTGIDPGCAPSRVADLMGSDTLIAGFLQAGYAVVATDYQGLDGDAADDVDGSRAVSGVRAHPYQDAPTAGANVIDSVRALRNLTPTASKRWAAMGFSQGGGASWAATSLAGSYGDGLELVGSVSVTPSVDTSPLAGLAAKELLSSYQLVVYLWTLIGLDRSDPAFAIGKYWHGASFADRADVAGCSYSGADAGARERVLRTMSSGDLALAPDEAGALAARLEKLSVPGGGVTAPMYVVYAGRDVYIDPSWTRHAIDRECNSGATILVKYDADAGHDSVDGSGAASWLAERFAGRAAPSSCGKPSR